MQSTLRQSPSKRYTRDNEELGRGATKIVYKGFDNETGAEVAWNSISMIAKDVKDKQEILNELDILMNMPSGCEYIMKFYDAWYDEKYNEIVLITELSYSGTLYHYVRNIKNPSMNIIKRWVIQLLIGIEFLHDHNIIHRDLKLKNIFINANTSKIIIGDFGICKKTPNLTSTIVGTQLYMAPEIYGGAYDKKVDIYSLGLCIIEMITGKIAYDNVTPYWFSAFHPEQPHAMKDITDIDAIEFINRCIDRDALKRPTAHELLRDKFLQITTCVLPTEIDMEKIKNELTPIIPKQIKELPLSDIRRYSNLQQKNVLAKDPYENIQKDSLSKKSSSSSSGSKHRSRNSPKRNVDSPKDSPKRSPKDRSNVNDDALIAPEQNNDLLNREKDIVSVAGRFTEDVSVQSLKHKSSENMPVVRSKVAKEKTKCPMLDLDIPAESVRSSSKSPCRTSSQGSPRESPRENSCGSPKSSPKTSPKSHSNSPSRSSRRSSRENSPKKVSDKVPERSASSTNRIRRHSRKRSISHESSGKIFNISSAEDIMYRVDKSKKQLVSSDGDITNSSTKNCKSSSDHKSGSPDKKRRSMSVSASTSTDAFKTDDMI